MAFAICLHSLVYGQVTADFSVNQTEACEVLAANFTDASSSTSGTIIEWKWKLGSINSTNQNPSTIFNEVGFYEICLTAIDDQGNEDTECRTDYIKVYANPTADFSIVDNGLCAPATIQFTDVSNTNNGDITSWTWGLGGSTGVFNTSNMNDPVESSYNVGGKYSISLLIEDEKGCSDIETKIEFVEILRVPEPSFETTVLNSCTLPKTVTINFIEDISPATYKWDFGNGETYEGTDPPDVEYVTEGEYDITLTSNDGQCESALIKEVSIKANDEIDVDLEIGASCAGREFTIEPYGANYDSIEWKIENIGEFSSLGPLTLTIDIAGCFQVEATLYKNGCAFEYLHPDCLEVLERPNLSIILDTESLCSVPTAINISADIAVPPSSYIVVTSPSGNRKVRYEQSTTYEATEFGEYLIEYVYRHGNGCNYLYSEYVNVEKFEVFLPAFGPSGCIPFEVSLMDSVPTGNTIVSYDWSISGDNFLHESQDAVTAFTLSDIGLYDVTLIATNDQGCTDTVSVEDYVGAGTPPMVDFTFTPDHDCANHIFQFTDASSSEANQWYWQFRDAEKFYSKDLLHSFADTGYFSITHVALFNGCPSDTMKLEDAILVDGPVAKLNKEYNCEDPYTVRLKNNSIAVDSFIWKIYIDNDTIYNSLDSFDFTFPDLGNYIVDLYTANFRTGCDYTRSDTIRITEPIASYTIDENAGCVPLNINLNDSSQDAISWIYSAKGGAIDDDTIPDPFIEYINPGVFLGPKLKVTDIHGCMDSVIVDSIYVNSVEAIPLFNEIVCIPDSIILIDSSVSLLGELSAWSWNIGEGYFESSEQNINYFLDTASILSLELAVQDTWGCTDTFFIEEAVNPVINHIDFLFESITCSNNAIQFVNQTVAEDVEQYSWDFGDGSTSKSKSPQHAYQSEGTYTVCLTLVEKRGCERTVCKENIIEVIDPVADFVADVTSIDCPPLIVNFSNNSQNYDAFEWNFGDGGFSSEVSAAHVYTTVGNFDVTLIAKRGEDCADTLVLENYINIDGPVGDFSFQSDDGCLPLAVEFTGDSDSDYSYTWDFGNGEVISPTVESSSSVVNYVYTETGTYLPKLILQNNSGCLRTFTGDPIVVNSVDLAFDKLDPFCDSPQNIEILNNSIASDNVLYTWEIDNGSTTQIVVDLDPNFTLAEFGNYTVSLKANLENCVDSISIPNAITIASNPVTDFSIPDDGLCQFAEIDLINNSSNAFGAITDYSWDFGDGNSSNQENPTHTYEENQMHIISLTATSEYGCIGEQQANTEILKAADIEIAPLDPFCRGDEAQIEVNITNPTAGSIINWEASNDLSCNDCLDPILTPQNSGFYHFSYTQENGCVQIDSVYAEFFDIDGPQLELSTDDLICEGDSTLVIISNYNPSYTYTWNSDPLYSAVSDDNFSLLAFPETDVDVFIEVRNEEGCVQENTTSIAIETFEQEILLEDQTYCVDQQIILDVEIGNDPVWSGTGLSCSDCDNPFLTVGQLDQDIYVTILSDNGCPFLDTMNIRGIPQDFVSAGPDMEICLGEEIQLDGSALGEASWTESVYIEDITDPKSMIRPAESGYFVFHSNIGECIDSDSVFIDVLEVVDIIAQGDTICFSEIGILSVDGNAYDYEWTDLRTSEKLENATIHELSPEFTTPYMVVGSRSTCIPDTQYTEIKVSEEIIFSHEDIYEVFPNKETQVMMEYSGDYNYEWMPREGLSCWDCPDPIFMIEESTEFTLIVTEPKSGCEAESRLYARYEEECTEQAFFLPNIFSPNSDGRNDAALVFAENPSEFVSLTIFDRWGEKMFFSEELDQGWDGLFRGEKAMGGVYVMKIDAICETTNDPYTFYADITLLR